MKKTLPFLLIIVSLILLCWGNKKQLPTDFPVKYENELFSISIPQGWEYDDSEWHGLESFVNRVDFYSKESKVWFRCRKSFFPIKWKDVYEVKEQDKSMGVEMFRCTDEKLVKEIDDVEVGGYPACILYYSCSVGFDDFIIKRYIIYQQDSHIVLCLNEEFFVENWDEAEELGDLIVNTIQLKKVTNPLENDSILIQSIFKNDSVDEVLLYKIKQKIENKDKDE